MKRLLIFAVATICVFGLFNSSAKAVFLLGPNLTYDGLPDTLQDNSVAFWSDTGVVGTIDAGDEFAVILRITESNTTGATISPSQGELAVLASFAVTAPPVILTPGPGGTVGFTLGPVPAASPLSIGMLLGPGPFGGAASFAPGTIAAVLSAPVGTTAPNTTSLPTSVAAFNSGTYMLDATAGFGAPGDFFQATFTDFDGSGTIVPASDYAALVNTTTTIGTEAGGFSYIRKDGLTGAPVIPSPVLHLFGAPLISGHDVALTSSVQPPNTTALGLGYSFRDQAFLTTNITPEPASVVVWGLLLTVVGLSIRNRRSRA